MESTTSELDNNYPMGMKATGAYFRHLREHLGLSQAEVARRAGASSSQIYRIEEGQGETRATLVAAVAQVLNARPEDVISLLADNTATIEAGQKLAAALVSTRNGAATPKTPLHPEVVAIAAQMTEFQLGKWVAMGERLLDER